MELRVKLMGALKAKAPPGDRLSLADGTTIAGVLRALDIPDTHVQIVMVGGRPQPNRESVVHDGDELTILPPVGGG